MSEMWIIIDDHVERIVGTPEQQAIAGPGGDVGEGLVIAGVHDGARCVGDYCVIHNPSPHPLSGWPLWWRQDRKMFERICSHGVGHPDPDQWHYWQATLPPLEAAAELVHTCCGCCTGGIKKPCSIPR